MKATMLVGCTAWMLFCMSAHAANTQQTKMKDCNAQAKTQTLSGDARQAFMKTCLSHDSAPAPKLNSQQQKMKQCNADAKSKGLAGAERKTFMSTCLKG